MKKTIFAVLALALVLGVSVHASARIEVNGQEVENPCTFEGDAEYVHAGADGDVLTVKGKLYNDRPVEELCTVDAHNGAAIEVTGEISDASAGDAVYAYNSTVTAGGNVYEYFKGAGIYATFHSKVTAGGNVNEGGEGDGVFARASTVEVLGQVLQAGAGSAVWAENGSVVTVTGDVWQFDDGNKFGAAIDAEHSKITVGGDAKGPVHADTYSEVIVEGSVKGDISKFVTGEAEGSGRICIGRLAGNAAPEMKDHLRYLIGLAEGSATFDEVTMTGAVSSGDDTVKGAKGKVYRCTSTFDLAGKTIVITPKTACREFRVEGLPGGVESAAGDGSAVLTFTDGFRGGMQNLNIVLVPEYTVTVIAGEGGSASADITSAAPGETVTLTAVPDEGRVFKEWQSGQVTVGADNTFTMPDTAVTVKAVFGKPRTPTVTPRDARVEEGQRATFTADAEGTGLTYQWYADRGSGWEKLEGADSAAYTTAPAVPGNDGCRYKCNVSGTDSNVAVLHVFTPVPATGDSSHMLLWAALLALSGAGLFRAGRKKRRSR